MSGGALGSAAGSALRRGPTIGSVTASTFLLAGSQALGILTEATGVKRGTFNDFQVNPGEASDTVPYIAGTVETVPHLITYFDFHSKKVKNDTQISQMLIQAGLDGLAGYLAGGGHFGIVTPDPPSAYIGLAEGTILGAIVAGLGQLRTASYRYYCGFLYGICHGPIDSITAVKVDERIVSNGAPADTSFLIDDPQAWGGDHVDGGVYAICDIISGKFWPQQLPNPYLVTQVSNAASFSGKAMFLVGGFTRAPESGYFAATPQGSPALRPLKLRVRRLPNNLGVPAYHNIGGDANIAECCYEWLTSPVFGVKKLPLSRIDVASFQLGAQKHFDQSVGVSVEMNSDVDVESALDKFTDLGGSIIYGSFNSGTIRYKVIQRDYSIPSLPVFRRGPDGSPPEAYNVIRVEGFTPGSWANTANDQSFTYIDRDNNYLPTTRYMQDTANRMLTGRVKSLAQGLDGVSNGMTAAFVGTRELRAGAYPRPPLTLAVNRDGYQREPGDVIKYIDNVDNFVKVLRVTEVQKLATDETAEIVLNCVEDQYGVGAAAYSPFVPAGFHLTLHLNLALEDSLVGLTSDMTGVAGLQDAFAKFIAVHLPQGASDSLQSLSDSVAISLRDELAFSDSINNLADALTTGTTGRLTESLSDDVNNLSDALVTDNATSTQPDVELDARSLLGADGSTVTQWDDTSGNGRNATPTFGVVETTTVQTNQLNGLQVARLNGSSMSWSTGPARNAFTVIAVLKCTSFASARNIISGQASGNLELRFNTSGKVELIDVGSFTVLATSNTALNTTSFYTVAATYDGATGAYAFYLNGSADGSGTTSTSGSVSAFARIGRRSGNGDPYSGDEAYVGLWGGVLNSTELTTRFNDLRTVWAHY